MSYDPFFPEEGGHATKATLAVCTGCPVQLDCLDYAIRNRINFGIWGGMSPKQRAKERTHRNRMRRLIDDYTKELAATGRRTGLHLAPNRGTIYLSHDDPECAEQA